VTQLKGKIADKETHEEELATDATDLGDFTADMQNSR
jgi:hypothetical protein